MCCSYNAALRAASMLHPRGPALLLDLHALAESECTCLFTSSLMHLCLGAPLHPATQIAPAAVDVRVNRLPHHSLSLCCNSPAHWQRPVPCRLPAVVLL